MLMMLVVALAVVAHTGPDNRWVGGRHHVTRWFDVHHPTKRMDTLIATVRVET